MTGNGLSGCVFEIHFTDPEGVPSVDECVFEGSDNIGTIKTNGNLQGTWGLTLVMKKNGVEVLNHAVNVHED